MIKFNLVFKFKDGTEMKAKPGGHFYNMPQTFTEIEQNISTNRYITGINDSGEEFTKYYSDIKTITVDL